MTQMTNTNKLTVAIPTHGMDDKEFFFKRCLDSLWNQTFQDFGIVVTDNSDDEVIKSMCAYYGGIDYYQNPIKGMAQNTNEAIRRSTGQYIKILYMDDFLSHDNVLETLMKKIGNWVIMGSDNNINPRWTDDIYTGNNKLGSPSALAFINDEPLLFDENLTWLLDCELYGRLYQRYGEPTIISGDHIGIGEGLHQMTYSIPDERKLLEKDYLLKNHV